MESEKFPLTHTCPQEAIAMAKPHVLVAELDEVGIPDITLCQVTSFAEEYCTRKQLVEVLVG
jgi:hypothetical protein